MDSVQALKEAICEKTGIAEEKQVLLMNGGEALAPHSRVCSYSSAGTDTSPIFLFNKSAIENPTAPVPVTDYGSDADLRERVESCINMEPSYNTVIVRTEMAKQIYDIAMEQVRVCERLVHDQHLQHQGWRAVVANLEDVITAFTASWNHLQLCFKQFYEQKNTNQNLLQNFGTDLQTLSRIPLLVELGGSEGTTLFDWINQKDHEKDLEQVANVCLQAVSRFDMSLLDELRQEAENLLNGSCNDDMKEIKGLEERLYGLEKLMAEARKLSAEVGDMSSALCKNQQRLANVRDPSIIPELCKSHKTQLQVMVKNHQQLRDYRRRCVQAKRELSLNLHQRLRWIMFVEKKLAELDEKILVHRENIRRLRNHMEIVQQIHLAPKIYVSAVAEVVRRRVFSKLFIQFASSIASDSAAIFNRETHIRQDFASALNNHFLATLFPGFGDSVPSFAVESPHPFDTSLPMLEDSHVDLLRRATPQLFPDETSVADLLSHLSMLRKYVTGQREADSSETKSESGVGDVASSGLFVHVASLKCSITDAIAAMRDQNKVCADAVITWKQQLNQSTQQVESEICQWVQEIEDRHHDEETRLKSNVSDLIQKIAQVEDERLQLETKVRLLEVEAGERRRLEEECRQLQDENESKRRIILEHEVDMVTTKEENEMLNTEIEGLRAEVSQLNSSLAAQDLELKLEKGKLAEENKLLKNEVDKLKVEVEKVKRISEKEVKKMQEKWEAEKNKEIKILREKMKSEHKLEMENLRIRFRLSSSVERAQDSLTMDPAFDRDVLTEELASLKDKLRATEQQHTDEVQALKQRHAEEIAATKQQAFSLNVSRLTHDKDKEIQQLKAEIGTLKSDIRSASVVSPVISGQAYTALDPETKVSRLESMIREKDTRIVRLQESLCGPSEKVAVVK